MATRMAGPVSLAACLSGGVMRGCTVRGRHSDHHWRLVGPAVRRRRRTNFARCQSGQSTEPDAAGHLMSDAEATAHEGDRGLAEPRSRPAKVPPVKPEPGRLEEALREHQAQSELALVGADLGTWDWNLQTGAMTFNAPWAQMLGYTPDEIEPHIQSWESLVHPDDRPRVREVLNAHLEGRTPAYETEHRLRAKSGRWVWVLDRGKVVEWTEEGRPLRATGTHLDITVRKQAEERIRQADQEWEQVFQAVNHPILVLDPQLRVLAANRTSTRALGTSEAAVRGRACHELFHGGAQEPPETCPAKRLLEGGRLEPTESVMEAFSGIFLVSCTPVCDEEGNLTRIVHIATDVTELGRAEERARKREAQLTQVSRLVTAGELAAGVAHQLTQPLSVIQNYAEACRLALRSGSTPPGQLASDLDEITVAAEHAGEIIGRFKKFARKRTPRRSTVDVNRIVEEAVQFVEPEVRRNDVRLQLHLCPQPPILLADSVLLQQVVLNLAQNAVEAMLDNDSDERTLVIRTSSPRSGEVEIAVSDTGPGIPPDIMDKLFDPFFTTKPERLGLGLSLCRSIVEAQSGHLEATRDPDRGMTFHLTLPVSAGGGDDGV